MATDRQIAANRLNAQKSTGPRTSAGKAASSMNALKTGLDAQSTLIRGEDPEALATLTREYDNRFRPTTPEQRDLVDTLISTTWLMRRLRRAETQLWNHHIAWIEDRDCFDLENPLSESFRLMSETSHHLQRRLDSLDRAFHRALRELDRLRSSPPEPDEPAPQLTVPEPVHSEIGFVLPPAPRGVPDDGIAARLGLPIPASSAADLPTGSSYRSSNPGTSR